jgi:parvulin-like peptidyl-prolyl isomerase
VVGLVILNLHFSGCESTAKKQSAIIPEEETIAVVNNKKITLARFQTRLHSFLQHYRELIATDEKQLVEIKNIVINQLIDDELTAQEASRKGIQVTDEEIELIIAESLTSYDRSNFDSYLKNNGLSEDEWKAGLRQYLIQKKMVNEEVIAKIPITKREIGSYYQKNKNELSRTPAVKVRNITLAVEEEAAAILSQLQRGKDFKDLIDQHSISPDKVADGDLGFVEKGDLPDEMDTEIFSKKFKNFSPWYTDVIRSQDGFHILKLEQYKPSRKLDLEEARPQIKQILIEEKWDEFYTQWIEKLRENATVTIDQAMLQREEGF